MPKYANANLINAKGCALQQYILRNKAINNGKQSINFCFPAGTTDYQLGINIFYTVLSDGERDRLIYPELVRILQETVTALAAIVEIKDSYAAGHQERVAKIACNIAYELGLASDQIEGIKIAASIHDIGKICIPCEILNKRDNCLKEVEYNFIKMHPEAGYNLIKNISFPWPVAATILQHHERLNGSGYPFGIHGKEIIVEARILAVADVLEAVSRPRPYRNAFNKEQAISIIIQGKGELFDPEVVAACEKLWDSGYLHQD